MSKAKRINSGEIFTNWTVLEQSENSKDGKLRYKCVCKCGVIKTVVGRYLLNGRSKSCGCLNERKFSKKDITNQKFSKLTVIEYVGSVTNKRIYKCKCDCGNTVNVSYVNLNNGFTKSCGCLSKRYFSDSPNYSGFNEISGSFWHHLVQSAKNRQIDFNLSIEYIYNLFIQQNKKCALSGIPISFGIIKNRKYIVEKTASLDRIDSNGGYIEGNVRWVHKDINKMRNVFSDDYFLYLCKAIIDYKETKH